MYWMVAVVCSLAIGLIVSVVALGRQATGTGMLVPVAFRFTLVSLAAFAPWWLARYLAR